MFTWLAVRFAWFATKWKVRANKRSKARMARQRAQQGADALRIRQVDDDPWLRGLREEWARQYASDERMQQ